MASLSRRPWGPQQRGNVVPPIALNEQATAVGQQTATLPLTQVLTAATETLLLSGPLPATPLLCTIHPNTDIEQTPFDLWGSGYITATATGNLQLKAYAGTSTTLGSNILLGASGTISQAAGTAPFWIHARLIFDSVSGLLCGDIEFYLNKTKVASVTLSNFPTGMDNSNDEGVESFCLSLTSAAAGSGTPTTINVANWSVG